MLRHDPRQFFLGESGCQVEMHGPGYVLALVASRPIRCRAPEPPRPGGPSSLARYSGVRKTHRASNNRRSRNRPSSRPDRDACSGCRRRPRTRIDRVVSPFPALRSPRTTARIRPGALPMPTAIVPEPLNGISGVIFQRIRHSITRRHGPRTPPTFRSSATRRSSATPGPYRRRACVSVSS